ncbi:MAG: hypothetical protein HYX35_02210 [Proteobacteria bacterium]|nr:hypothetical protein [Pseudomonadota bacterium]
MTKNVFTLMLSAFILVNAQSSYAMHANEVTEEETTFSSQRTPTSAPRWVPQAPVKTTSALYQKWLRKAATNPGKYKINGTTPWVLQ